MLWCRSNFCHCIRKHHCSLQSFKSTHAKSIMGLLSLGIPKEIFIVIHTNNKDVISKFEEDIFKWKVEE